MLFVWFWQQIKFSWHYVRHSQMMKKVAAILSTKLIPFYRVTNIKVHSAYVYRGLRGIHRFSHYLQIAGKSYSYHRVFPTISKCYMVPPQHSQAFSLTLKDPGGGAAAAHQSQDRLPFLTGSCYVHKNS